MKRVIARIKLNPGQGGYFDPITRIHLTHGDPERDVYAGMNTEGLKQAVRNKRISLVSGSLGDFIPPFKLVRQSDGKVVLVANNQKKNTQQPITVKKDDVKTPVNVPKQDNTKLPVKPTPAEEQKIEPGIIDQKDVTVPESKENNVSEPVIIEELMLALDIGEKNTTDAEEQKSAGSFKKGKKNKGNKKESEELKVE